MFRKSFLGVVLYHLRSARDPTKPRFPQHGMEPTRYLGVADDGWTVGWVRPQDAADTPSRVARYMICAWCFIPRPPYGQGTHSLSACGFDLVHGLTGRRLEWSDTDGGLALRAEIDGTTHWIHPVVCVQRVVCDVLRWNAARNRHRSHFCHDALIGACAVSPGCLPSSPKPFAQTRGPVTRPFPAWTR